MRWVMKFSAPGPQFDLNLFTNVFPVRALKFDARRDDKLGADCIEYGDCRPDTQTGDWISCAI